MNNPIITASGAIPAYACVKVSTATNTVEVCNTSTDIAFNFTTGTPTLSGAPVVFQTSDNQLDIVTLRAGGSIAIGNLLVPSTAGTVVAASSGQFIAMSSAISGQNLTARRFNAGATANFIAPGTGATTRTLDSKLGDTISAKDFGAVGDGVADDTLKLQAALDASVGKSLYLPPGIYKTTAVLRIKEKTCFFAQQGTATIDVQPTGGTVSNTHGILIDGNEVVIDGLKISGTNQFKITGPIRSEYAKGIVADSQISGAVYTRPTITNCLIFKWGGGIELRRASTYSITNNRLWGGAQFDESVDDAGTTDISIYGSEAPNDSFRGIITGNFCLGNQDVGIGTSGNSGDHDITISNNVIQAMKLDVDGVTPIAITNDAENKSRYAIIVGYGGLCSCRVAISNNVIRDYAHTGIDCQTGLPPGGDLVVSGNVVSRCGWGIQYPSDVSLKAGIFVAGGADSITGNIVLDCTRVGIQINSPKAIDGIKQHTRPVISGNNIARIAIDTNSGASAETSGRGIQVIGAFTSGVLVANNRIQATAGTAIYTSAGAGAAQGDIHIVGNQITTTSLWGGIIVSNGGSRDSSVVGNRIVGNDNTTDNGTFNTGIWSDLGVGKVHCMNNAIEKFFRGIRCQSTAAARTIGVSISGNALFDCNTGIGGSTGTIIVQSNSFRTCTQPLGGTAWQGTILAPNETQGFNGSPVVLIADSSSPQGGGGTWAVGDRCIKTNPSVGAPKGWICTVAGSPGTWVSEGNL